VLVINDGSTDKTLEIATRSGADVVVSNNINMGLGHSFSSGIKKALSMGADIVVTLDADQQFDPKEIPVIIEDILKGNADVVLGSRFIDKTKKPAMPLIKRFGNKIFTTLVNILTHQRFYDTQCGFRAYSRNAALSITSFGGLTYTQEVIINLSKKGFRITEKPCTVMARKEGKSKVADNVLVYGVRALMIILKTMRDYNPFLFFGIVGLFFLLFGLLIDGLLFIRWLLVGLVSPYRSLVIIASLSVVLGLMFIVVAFVVDMLDRQRTLLEEILYKLNCKKNEN